MTFFFELGHALKKKRKDGSSPFMPAPWPYFGPEAMVGGAYGIGRGGHPSGRGGHSLGRGGHEYTHDVHPAVKEGMLIAAQAGDPRAITFAQRRGWLGPEDGGPSTDPREGFGGPNRGGLGGVFAGRGNHGGHHGDHHGGDHGHPSEPHDWSQQHHHDALTGGFGPPSLGPGAEEDGEPPPYGAEHGVGGLGSPGMRGGRGRGFTGRGTGHPMHPIMDNSGIGHYPLMSQRGGHGHGRGRGHSRCRSHAPFAPNGW
ncbi:MAG: hypothetical protein Q9157_000131 [Trypethelium eluteriae]